MKLKPPPLTSAGNYEPSALRDFLRKASDKGLTIQEVADILRVSRDRIEYLQRDGWEFIIRQRTPLARRA